MFPEERKKWTGEFREPTNGEKEYEETAEEWLQILADHGDKKEGCERRLVACAMQLACEVGCHPADWGANQVAVWLAWVLARAAEKTGYRADIPAHYRPALPPIGAGQQQQNNPHDLATAMGQLNLAQNNAAEDVDEDMDSDDSDSSSSSSMFLFKLIDVFPS